MARMVESSSVTIGKVIGFLLCGAAVAILLVVVAASGQQPPIKIAIVQEPTRDLSGPGTYMVVGATFAVRAL